MPTSSAFREALLERTFSLYWRHLPLWIGVLLPVAATAWAVHALVARIVASVIDPSASPQVLAAAAAVPRLAAAAWLIAGIVGAQAIALRDARSSGRSTDDSVVLPPLRDVLVRLVGRFAGTLATTVVVLVHVAALVALGAGAAAGLAWLPLGLLPRLGASAATARSIALLVLPPLLVAGLVPALWWLGRHALAIPFSAIDGRSAWSSLRRSRDATRGCVGSVLGLLVVTTVASSVFVLLFRAAGSLATLLVAPERFRPIFGEGPLRSGAGAGVQLGTTLAATFVTLPLVLMPLAVIAESLGHDPGAEAPGLRTPSSRT